MLFAQTPLCFLCYTIFFYVSWHIYKIFIFSSSVGLDLVTIRALLCWAWSTTTIRPTRQGAWFHGNIWIITSRLSSGSYNWATILIHKQISVLKKQKQLYINNRSLLIERSNGTGALEYHRTTQMWPEPLKVFK